MRRHRVAVTGIGLVTPLGHDAERVWKDLLAGRSATATIRGFDVSSLPVRIGAEVAGFDPLTWLSAKTVRRTGRATHFALAAAHLALHDSGWLGGGLDPRDAAVILGSGYGSLPSVEDAYRTFHRAGWRRNHFLAVPMCMPNAPGSQIAMEFGFRGPSYTVAAACVAGAQAVANGFQAIASGGVRRALVGGVDVTLVPGAFTAWCRLGLLSRRNHDPQGASAPFSADRDGLVLADGAAVLTLERLDDARDRGARVYAELAGAGLACRAPNLTAVSVEGEVEGLQRALADAGLAPGEVGYVNAHGSSTRQNDAVEARALNAVFGPGPGRPAVSSTKSALGHAMGASGAIECAITALALRDQVLPPSLNLRERDPECDLDVVTGAARATEVWAALSSSFAFGGSVVVLALRRA